MPEELYNLIYNKALDLISRREHSLKEIKDKLRLRYNEADTVEEVVDKLISNNLINELKDNDSIKPEVFFNKETRFDFLIKKKKQEKFIEVKNVTLTRERKIAEFPDAVTSRGSKHLLTLIDAIKNGYKSYLLFLVQIQGMEYFKIAKDIDNDYYQNYLIAKKAGVKFLAYRCNINSKEIKIGKKIDIIDE